LGLLIQINSEDLWVKEFVQPDLDGGELLDVISSFLASLKLENKQIYVYGEASMRCVTHGLPLPINLGKSLAYCSSPSSREASRLNAIPARNLVVRPSQSKRLCSFLEDLRLSVTNLIPNRLLTAMERLDAVNRILSKYSIKTPRLKQEVEQNLKKERGRSALFYLFCDFAYGVNQELAILEFLEP
jgi:hypothetical protein